jgi:hypothetical protein
MMGFLYDSENAGTEFPTYPDTDDAYDLDDKFNLQSFPEPGTWSETEYNVVFEPLTIYSEPFGSGDNYGIWFDRDGVAPSQEEAWGAVDGGTFNTGGVYNVQLTFTKHNATTGVVHPLFFPDLSNDDAPGGYGVPTGFESLPGGGYQYLPAGISFEADETKMAAMRVAVLGNPGNGTIVVQDLQVTGHPSDTPVTRDLVADPNPAPVHSAVQLSAEVESGTDVPVGFADYSLDGGDTWAPLGDAWVYDELIETVSDTITAPDDPGSYKLCVRATDNYLNLGEPTCITLVIYDPDGGFVTGGGWIDSPVNQDHPYMRVGGKANFGFVVKYKKDGAVPKGNMEFVFQAGDLNFHSTSYEWLLVTESNAARFTGTGNIDGADTYEFMIWAGDGTGPDGADTFRIKIWEGEEDNPLYDNGLDQSLGGGSIVVHTK